MTVKQTLRRLEALSTGEVVVPAQAIEE